ncbi:MAG TPA: hypothetical protein VMC06_10805 [Opitutaceae bacterium]|nr:hypothetical protein [Opitutaceae bacterium]
MSNDERQVYEDALRELRAERLQIENGGQVGRTGADGVWQDLKVARLADINGRIAEYEAILA